MTELEQLYTDAIAICETWRAKRPIAKATPNELHLYNVFTQASTHLANQLACIQDVQGNYNLKGKK